MGNISAQSFLPSLQSQLNERLHRALTATELPTEGIQVHIAADTRFGDYQTNAAMVLARSEKTNPRVLAQRILDALDVSDLCEPPNIAGAGFINFSLRKKALAQHCLALSQDARMGAPILSPKKIIIDFSSPNVAKPMHVGHIRSTILGDCLARVGRYLGHEVITDNHIGDWGTQFGKVIYGWKHLLDEKALADNPLGELVRLYREVNVREENDAALREAVRQELVKLQQGDEENRAIWQRTIDISLAEFKRIYALLDVHFDEWLGESFYNDALEPLVKNFLKKGIARPSEGAICIFFDDLPELKDRPCLIRKSDGGFLYATTDLATIAYRAEHWAPDAIWYITGAPQALHFRQVFEAARRDGAKVVTEHIPFGSILGKDRKIMKTRSGENVQLDDVLNEAIERARRVVAEKNPSLENNETEQVAKKIGLGAVKYAELSQHRMTDYVFDWEKMLSFQGNTAPYLQNAYVRIRSIFRKLTTAWPLAEQPAILLDTDAERKLALTLAQFGETLPSVLEDFRPNLLANYLYTLATTFHSFYEACPVLKADLETQRNSRLQLAELTAGVLKQGLDLLGIQVPERM
ncbi:MAG: arginine--tRNA ligase [Chthoniobacterales bacterium]